MLLDMYRNGKNRSLNVDCYKLKEFEMMGSCVGREKYQYIISIF